MSNPIIQPAPSSLWAGESAPRQPFPLRDYQEAARARTGAYIRQGIAANARAARIFSLPGAYLALPTGVGKAVILAALAHDVTLAALAGEAGTGRALLIAHREELVLQLAAQCEKWLPGRVGVIMAGRDDLGMPVTVASIQTLRKPRLARYLASSPAPITALLVDEAHHAHSRNGYNVLVERVREHSPHVAVIGCTATPYRADKESMQGVFPVCLMERTIEDMQEAGVLAPLRLRRVKVPMRLADLLRRASAASGEPDYDMRALSLDARRPDVLQALIEGTVWEIGERPALAFCVDVAHARMVAGAYAAAGVRAAAVWGEMPHAERVRVLADWRAGRVQLVCNCGVLTEGFDYPRIACLVMARPTQSLVLYTQMIGRGTRTADGKRDCLILEATPGRPDPAQITLGDVVPVADDEEGEEEQGETDGKARSAPRLTLLDPRHDSKYRWLYLPEAHAYIASVDRGSTLYLLRDPDTAHGSGLYRGAVLTRDPRDGSRKIAPIVGVIRPITLRTAQRQARAWLDNHAALRIARKDAGWHRAPATERQRAFLARHAPDELRRRPHMTEGQASEAIAYVVAGWDTPHVAAVLWGVGEGVSHE